MTIVPTRTCVLRVDNLSKTYQSVKILDKVSLKAEQGSVTALLGQSGSGKSTLLRCINMLTLPDAGEVYLNEKLIKPEQKRNGDLTRRSEQEIRRLRCRLSMVFQQFNLWPHLTILENIIEAPIHVLKRSKKQVIKEAEALLEKVNLAPKKNAYPSQLSGGQQQRAAIARALAMQPEVLLFDEPTSALDPEMVSEVLTVMQNLAAEGKTMLIATHEIGFARELASHIAFLDKAHIIEQGIAKEVFNAPRTERFQQFLAAVYH